MCLCLFNVIKVSPDNSHLLHLKDVSEGEDSVSLLVTVFSFVSMTVISYWTFLLNSRAVYWTRLLSVLICSVSIFMLFSCLSRPCLIFWFSSSLSHSVCVCRHNFLCVYSFSCFFFIYAEFWVSFDAVFFTATFSIFTYCICMPLLALISEFAKSILIVLAKIHRLLSHFVCNNTLWWAEQSASSS